MIAGSEIKAGTFVSIDSTGKASSVNLSLSSVYAIRQKSTGYFLPMRWKSARGYTHDEPEPSFPRLLPSLLSAKRALSAWLQGEWKEDTYQGDWGNIESYGPSPEPKPGRHKDDMEIVRLSLHVEEVCEL